MCCYVTRVSKLQKIEIINKHDSDAKPAPNAELDSDSVILAMGDYPDKSHSDITMQMIAQ